MYVGKNGMVWSSELPKNRESSGKFDDSKVGPAEHCRNLKSIAQAFKVFLTEEMIEEVVRCTNLYGERYFTEKKQKWKPVTVNELWAFIGILIAAGRNHQNHVNLNTMWSSNKAWTIDFYRLGMSKNRFSDIYTVLRFDNISTRPQRFRKSNDKLEPIRNILDKFLNNCLQSYVPSSNLTIDERLCLFRGKMRFFYLYDPRLQCLFKCF